MFVSPLCQREETRQMGENCYHISVTSNRWHCKLERNDNNKIRHNCLLFWQQHMDKSWEVITQLTSISPKTTFLKGKFERWKKNADIISMGILFMYNAQVHLYMRCYRHESCQYIMVQNLKKSHTLLSFSRQRFVLKSFPQCGVQMNMKLGCQS